MSLRKVILSTIAATVVLAAGLSASTAAPLAPSSISAESDLTQVGYRHGHHHHGYRHHRHHHHWHHGWHHRHHHHGHHHHHHGYHHGGHHHH